MKKIFKWLAVIFGIFFVLFILALLTLKIMFPMSKIKAQVQEQVKNKLNREIDFKDFSLSFNGLSITDFALSEKTTFKEGTFIFAKQAQAKVDLKALFHKQIKIENIGLNNFTINIVKDKEGKFNFDDLLSVKEEQKTQEESSSENSVSIFEISAQQIYTKEAVINFTDESTDTNFSINNLNIQIDNFDLSKDFAVMITCLSKIKMPDFTLDPVLFKMQMLVNLASLDLPKAKAEIKDFSINYDKANLNFAGLIADFDSPQINLTGTLNGIDDKFIKHFIQGEITPFSLPEVNMILSSKLNLENSLADISQVKASIGNSFIKTRASLDYSKQDISFSSNTNMAISLDEVAAMAKETLQAFDLKGSVSGHIEAWQNKKLNVKGNINFKDIGAKILNKNLEKTNGSIRIKSLEDISTNKISGVFDLEPWNLTLAYKQEKNTNIDLSFYMKKFTLEDINFETFFESKETSPEQEKAQTQTQNSAATAQKQSSDLYNLKADITIDKIENNVLTANNFTVRTDIKDFDTTIAKTKGYVKLNSKDIEIRDIDKLMSSSKLLKAMFTSVKIIQKAFNFAKLDNSSITNGIIKCRLIDAEYTFNNGILSIVKSDIDSDLTVIRASGNADLLKESVDMQIQAQIGKTGSNGFKPMVINVKGPLSDPKYKVDVLSSLASILSKNNKGEASSQQNAKNIANNAGDLIKMIGGLFKK